MKLIMTMALALTPAMAFAQNTATTTTNPKADNGATTESHAKMDNTTANTKEDTTRKIDSKNPDQMMTDARIASILHKVNKEEVDAGKLAEKRGTSSDVKEFGRMLIKDHQEADQKLTAMARKANLDLETLNGPDKDMLKTDQKKMDQVKTMKGAEFDRAYGSAMYDGHDDVIKMLDDHKKDIKS